MSEEAQKLVVSRAKKYLSVVRLKEKYSGGVKVTVENVQLISKE